MKLTLSIKHKFLSAALVALAVTNPYLATVRAEEAGNSVSQETTPAGPVTVYGQALNPHLVEFYDSNYTWEDLRPLMPAVLPDAGEGNLTAAQVCARLDELNDQYLIEVEKKTNALIYEMEFVVNSGKAKPPADLALTDRLAMNSQEAYNELLQFLPSDHEEIREAKIATLKSFTMIMLRDAALANCPDYAKANNLTPLTNYTGPK